MGSFSGVAGGAGTAVLAGATLMAAFPAQSMASGPRVVKVPCSAAALAASITAANTVPAVLRLTAKCTYSITTPATAATGLPTVTGNVTLVGGPGTAIRRAPGAALFRILDVAAGGTLRVTGIFILDGGTAGLGGGIQNAGTLVLRHVTLSGNRAGNGGAVANSAAGTATVSRSLLNANTTTHNTSGGLGGGISNLGTTSLNRTLVTSNRGSAGGGIATGNTNVTLVRSIVRNNIPDNCNPLNTIPGCVG
jgi:hypothetical protein